MGLEKDQYEEYEDDLNFDTDDYAFSSSVSRSTSSSSTSTEEDYDHTTIPLLMYDDQPSWIAELEDVDPFSRLEPTLFPYHISTDFSIHAPPSSSGRRLSGSSTIVTNFTTSNTMRDNYDNNKFDEALDTLRLRLLVEKIHKNHLQRSRRLGMRPRPSFARRSRSITTKLRTEDLPKDDPKVLQIQRVESQLEKITATTDDPAELLPLYKRLFWLALEVKATRTAHAALRRSIGLRSNLIKPITAVDRQEDAYLYLLLAKAQKDMGQPAGAVSNFQQALDIWSNRHGLSADPDPMDLADTLFLMGEAQLSTNNPKLAIKSFHKALAIYHEQQAYASIVKVCRHIGQIHIMKDQQNIDLALQLYQETLEFFGKPEHLGNHHHELVADIWMAMGDCYYYCYSRKEQQQEQQQQGRRQQQQQQQENAMECYQEALSIFRQVLGDNHELVIDALVALGDLFASSSAEKEQALFYYREVLRLDKNSSCRLVSADVMLKTAILLFQQGKTILALEKFQHLIGIGMYHQHQDDDDDDDPSTSETYFNALISIGVCYYVEGNKKATRKCLKDAINMSQQSELFVNAPIVEKLLRISLAQVDNINDATKIGSAIKRIKQAVVLKQEQDTNKHNTKLDESDLETIQESISSGRSGGGSAGDVVVDLWYYYLDKDPLGKFPTGWHPFEVHAGLQLEDMYNKWKLQQQQHYSSSSKKKKGFFGQSLRSPQRQQQKTNKSAAGVSSIISNESNGFSYEIDFQNMTQRNTTTGRIRPIQRTLDRGRVPLTNPSISSSFSPPPPPPLHEPHDVTTKVKVC